MNAKKRKIVTLSLWGFASGVLVAYAFVVYHFMDSPLGFVTTTAIWSTDVILYLIYHNSIITSSTLLSVTVIFNRFWLFVFGGTYWIYGYMILYIIYGLILTKSIAAKRFPFAEAFHDINLSNIS